MWTVAEPVVREWMRAPSRAGRRASKTPRDGAAEIGRFLGGVPALLSRGAALVEQLDDITRDGLVLAPETGRRHRPAEARRDRWTTAGAVGDRGSAGPGGLAVM